MMLGNLGRLAKNVGNCENVWGKVPERTDAVR